MVKNEFKRVVDIDDVYDFCFRHFDGKEIVYLKEMDAGFFNSIYEVSFADGRKMVLKAAPPLDTPAMSCEKDMIKKETELLAKIRRSKSIPVPRVVKKIEDDPLFDTGSFFMEFVDGIVFRSISYRMKEPEKQDLYTKLGEYTRKLHSMSSKTFGYGKSARRSWSVVFAELVDDVLSDAKSVDAYIGMTEERIMNIIYKFYDVLALVKKPSLLHRDLWNENVVIDPETCTVRSIIDWERAIYGDPLMDFVFGCIEGPHSDSRKKAFYTGYGETPKLLSLEKSRINLYYMYFLLLLIVEGYFRNSRDISVERKNLDKLEKVVSELERARVNIPAANKKS